jgi:hypothetical protein
MPDLFETDVETIQVLCKNCGRPLEIANSAMSVFGSLDSVLCMECLLAHDTDSKGDVTVPLPERIRLIDAAVDDFAAHLRNVLLRCVKPDLTWNRAHGIEEWPDPLDTIASAFGPGIWYAMRRGRHRAGEQDDQD